MPSAKLRCSFCLKPPRQVVMLVSTPENRAHICDRCVEHVAEAVDRERILLRKQRQAHAVGAK